MCLSYFINSQYVKSINKFFLYKTNQSIEAFGNLDEIMKISRGQLKKLEEIFQHLGYKVRYEKGHFRSGYCLLQDRPIAIINKFFDTDARFHTLLTILESISPDFSTLSDEQQRLYACWSLGARRQVNESASS